MKKTLFAVLLGTAALAAHAFSPAQLQTQLQQQPAVHGSFTQQRHIQSAAKPMQTEGRFALQQHKGLLWQIHKPLALRLRVRADGVWQWDGKNWRKAAGQNAAQIKLFTALIGGDLSQLQKQFDLKLSGRPDNWQLTLLPKTALLKQIFKHINIQGDRLVKKIELHEQQGERTVMQFQNLQSAAALPAESRAALE